MGGYQFGSQGPYWNGRSMLGGPPDAGNVYWVIPKTKSFLGDFMKRQGKYPDGSMAIYPDDGDGLGIAAALAACKGGRNDYVYVLTGNYNLTAALTLAGKSSVHLIGVNGGGYDVGTMGAAALTQTGSCENVIMEAYGELSGFQLINKVNYSAVTIATGKWRMNIHHNYFHMVQGTEATIKTVGTGLSYGRLANNRFETWVAGNHVAVINIVGATACDVCDNIITMNSGTITAAVSMGNSAQSTLVNNIVSDCNGGATLSIGFDLTATVGITAIGNRIACVAGDAFTGGTADRTFIDNRTTASGGATPVET